MKLNAAHKTLKKNKLLLLLSLFLGMYTNAQPVANFSSNVVAGCGPLKVTFKDSSSGNPTSWVWDFGNGGSSNSAGGETIYTTPGFYTVKLTVKNASGTDSIIKKQYIQVYQQPTAKFTVADTVGCAPFFTRFTDQSIANTGTLTRWEWNFDDNSTSIEQNPLHAYATSGRYNISLRVYNSGGCYSDASRAQGIKVYDSLVAKFKFSKATRCKPPETIQFDNFTSSPGNTLTYLWDFGDGTKSTDRSPKHTYLTADSFTVSMIVKNNLGCSDTLVLKDSMVIYNIKSTISAPDTICINSPATFINTTIPTPLGYDWKFSDGDLISDTAAVKSWPYKGSYTVKLFNYLLNCKDSISKTIRVIDAPAVNFKVDDTASCKIPLTINFTSQTANAVEWLWNFGDGSPTSNMANPVHTYNSYPADSTFPVTLTIKNTMGCVATNKLPQLVKIRKPIVNINTAEGGGCIPYVFKPSPDVWATDPIVSYQWDFGDGSPRDNNKNPSHTYNALGNYNIKLIVKTADGCEDSTTVIDGVKIGTKPTVDFNFSIGNECAGTDIRFTDLSVTADKWQWNFGDNTTSATKNPAHAYNDTGLFSVKLVAWNNGCPDSVTKNKIIRIKPAVAKFGVTYNCTNRRLVQFSDSSILALTWQWDFGDGTSANGPNQTHTYAAGGKYNVTLKVTNGSCTDTSIKQVNVIDFTPVITASSDSICRGGQITFNVNNVDTADTEQFIWNFGDGIVDSTNLPSIAHTYINDGSYAVQLTIRDKRGCSETFTKSSNIKTVSPQIGFTTNTAGACLNAKTNVIFTDTSNVSSGIKSWTWSFGDGQSVQYDNALPPSVSHIYTAAGTFYPKLKIVDGSGCVSRFTSPNGITVSQPVADFTANHVKACNNDTIVLYNNSTGPSLTYKWDFGDGTFATDSAPLKIYISNATYALKLTVTDKFGCTDSMVKNNYIDVREVIASFTASDTLGTCIPFPVTLQNTSVNSIDNVWDLGDGNTFKSNVTTHSYIAPGIFVVKLTATRSRNCVAVATKKIEVRAPDASFTYSPTDGCAPLDVTFKIKSNQPLTYEWDFRDGNTLTTTDTTTVHTYSFPGQHIPLLLVKDSSGCVIPLLGKKTITLYNTNVGFSADSYLVCDSGTIKFTDTSFSGSPIKTYLWKFGDGSTANVKNPTHFYNVPGIYTVSLYITTVYGCSDSLIKTNYIQVRAKPSIAIQSDTSFCGPSAVNFKGLLLKPDNITSWQWDFGNGNASTLQNPPAEQYSNINSYAVQLIGTNSGGCTDTATRMVTIHPIPPVNAGADTAICVGTSAALNATGADIYTWSPATGLSCINCASPVSSTRNNITYAVKGKTIYGCEATDSISIEVKKPFTITGLQPFDSLCSGNSISLTVTGAENYLWSPSGGLSNNNTASVVASPNSSTVYKVIGFDSKNCFKDSATINLKVNPTPTVNAGNDTSLLIGNSIQLNIQNSADVTNWLWTPGTSLSCNTCPNPIAKPEKTTEYTITVSNNSNCSATDKLTIFVTCDNTNIFLPSAFTPNNDGLNDYFYPMGQAVDKIQSLKIFNRYGEIVYLKDNFKANERNAGWNGTFKGKPASMGSYVYYLKVLCKNGETIELGGKILLLR